MKKVYKALLFLLVMFGLLGCGGDNSYDGVSGLISSNKTDQSSVDSNILKIYENVILPDANIAYEKSLELVQAVKDLNKSKSSTTLASAQTAFKELALAYKRVESAYVAGRESDEMRDLADFEIEHFVRSSKSDTLFSDLERVFNAKGSLYKNSHKGITALEYTLFDMNISSLDMLAKMNPIRRESAVIMAQTISSNLKKVRDYYLSKSRFSSLGNEAVGLILNQLVDNAYKLKEKRIGDAAGFTVKFKNDPDVTRLEYYKSVNSLPSIKEILKTHKRVMQNGLTDIAKLGNAFSEAEAIVDKIDEALAICDSFLGPIETNLVSAKTRELYNTVANLQDSYTALINSLNFKQDLLEADGD